MFEFSPWQRWLISGVCVFIHAAGRRAVAPGEGRAYLDCVHELALAESLVELIREKVEESSVRVVRLEVGKLSLVIPEALTFCFQVLTQGTPMEAAVLEIEEIAGTGRCKSCGEETALEGPILSCPCGSYDLEILRGDELRLKEVEVA